MHICMYSACFILGLTHQILTCVQYCIPNASLIQKYINSRIVLYLLYYKVELFSLNLLKGH